MKSAQLLKNVASNYGRLVVGMASGLFLTPFVLHRLGSDVFGMWSLTLSISSFLGITDFGLLGATARYIPHYYALKDNQNLQRIVSSLFSLYSILALVCLAIGGVLALAGPHAFHVAGPAKDCFSSLLFNASIAASLGFLSVTPIQCVIGSQRMDLMNVALLFGQVAYLLLTVIALNLGQGAVFLSLLQVGLGIYSLIAAIVLMKRVMPQINLRPGWDPTKVRQLAVFAGSAIIVSSSNQVVNNADNIIIGLYISVSAVAGYSLVLKVVQIIRGFMGSGVTALGYYTSAQTALDNRAGITTLWCEATKWSLALTVPMCVICMALAPQLLKAWAGDTFGAAPIALAILSFGLVFEAASCVSHQVLINSGHHRVLALVYALECAANLLLSVILARSIGIVGVAFGTVAPALFRNLIAFPYLIRKHFDIQPQQHLSESVIPGLIPSVPTAILVFGFLALGLPSDRPSLGALLCVCAAATVTTSFFVCLPPHRREQLISKASSMMRSRIRTMLGSVRS